MSKEFFEKLSNLIDKLNMDSRASFQIEVKHFFSGATLYVDGKMCVSWSPVGLAFKLPEEEVARLIEGGVAKPLKYFPNGHVKKGYALFENPDLSKQEQWKEYFLKAVEHVRDNK